MPPDTTESGERAVGRPPIQDECIALDEARLALGVVGMPQTTKGEALLFAQAQATLAVAEEIRALREQFDLTGQADTVGDQIAFAVENVQQAFVAAAHTVSDQAMRGR